MAAGNMTIGTALFGAGPATQYEAAKTQERAQRRAERRQAEANRINKAKANVQRAIERRRAVAQARQGQAINAAQGVALGIGEQSSALQGANAVIGSNLASSVAGANREFVTGQQTFDLAQASARDVAGANRRAARLNMYGNWINQATNFEAGNMFALGSNPSTQAPYGS